MADLDWRNDNETDDRLNPAELHNREQASGSENSGSSGGSGDSTTQNIDNVRDAESAGGVDSWANNVKGSSGGAGASGGAKGKLMGGLKKIGASKATPLGLLGGSMLGMLGIGGFFAVPGAYVVHITEIVTQRWNFQQVGMKHSDDMILDSKLGGGKALCNKFVTIRCKFSTFSKKELEALEKQGITVEGGKEPLLKKGGRKKATNITLKYGEYDAGSGKMIEKTQTFTAADAMKELRKPNSRLRIATTSAYNHNLFGFSDKRFWKIAKGKLKINKRRPLTDEDAKSKDATMKKIKDVAQEGEDGSKTPKGDGAGCKDKDGKAVECATRAEEDRNKDANDKGKQIADEAAQVGKDGTKMGFTDQAAGIAKKIGMLGFIQMPCDFMNMMNLIENGAKTIRAIQLARVGMIIMKTGSLIKSGDAKPSDVRALADILTEVRRMDDGSLSKAATDSFSYRNAAFKDRGVSESAMNFAVAGSLLPELVDIKNKIYDYIPGDRRTVRTTCKIVNNKPAQILSAGAGIAAGLLPGVNVANAAKVGAQAAIGVIIGQAMDKYFVPMLINVMSGVVIDNKTYGEALGDAFVTGYQVTAGEVANTGGGVPMSPNDALNNATLMDIVSKENATYERETRSPWDINSPYTMMGSLFGQFVPYTSQFSSIQGTVSALGSITTSSLKRIISPTAAAADQKETLNDYISTDDTYAQKSISSTPQGAPIIGLPAQVLAITPEQAYEYMMSHQRDGKPDPYIDRDTGEPLNAKYKKFIENCTDERQKPFGSDQEEDVINADWSTATKEKPTDGLECMVTDEEGNFKKENWETGLKDSDSKPPTDPKLDEDITSKEAANSSTDGQLTPKDRLNFLAWYNHMRTIQNREDGFTPAGGNTDSSSDSGVTSNWSKEDLAQAFTGPCASGTEDIGIKPTMFKGKDIPSRVCALTGFTSTSGESNGQYNSGYSGGMILVNARVSEAWLKALTDAKAAGVLKEPVATSSWRTPEHQRDILGGQTQGRPGVAGVGMSNHQAAYAIDFNMGLDSGNTNSYSQCASRPRPCTPPNPSPLYDWLTANGKKYGFSQISNEYWHFEPNALHGDGSS